MNEKPRKASDLQRRGLNSSLLISVTERGRAIDVNLYEKNDEKWNTKV